VSYATSDLTWNFSRRRHRCRLIGPPDVRAQSSPSGPPWARPRPRPRSCLRRPARTPSGAGAAGRPPPGRRRSQAAGALDAARAPAAEGGEGTRRAGRRADH